MEIEEVFKIAILIISFLLVMIGFISIIEDMINIKGWLEFILGIMITIPFYSTKSK
jgi:hypothetical protein